MDDKTHTFTSPTIFGLLEAAGLGWAVYGYDAEPLTKSTFTQIATAAASHFGKFTDFQAAAAAGTLPPYSVPGTELEFLGQQPAPQLRRRPGRAAHPRRVRGAAAGPGWPGTLLVITYDEHGGCYDHVPPPWGAVPPDSDTGEFSFGFERFGVRVPAVLVSPLIAPGTVYRVPAGGTPLDHTSILKTVEQPLEPAQPDRAGRGRPRLRRRAHPHHPAHRRCAGQRHRPGRRRTRSRCRHGLSPGSDPGRADLPPLPGWRLRELLPHRAHRPQPRSHPAQ